MTDRTAPDALPTDLAALPILPTGSGVADLEVAYEQMRLIDATNGLSEESASSTTRDDSEEVEAHPS